MSRLVRIEVYPNMPTSIHLSYCVLLPPEFALPQFFFQLRLGVRAPRRKCNLTSLATPLQEDGLNPREFRVKDVGFRVVLL